MEKLQMKKSNDLIQDRVDDHLRRHINAHYERITQKLDETNQIFAKFKEITKRK